MNIYCQNRIRLKCGRFVPQNDKILSPGGGSNVIIKVINCGFNETIKLRAKCVNNGKDSRWFSVEREEINVSHGKFMLKGIIFLKFFSQQI